MLAQYLSYEFIALFMFITMLAMMFTGQRVFGAIGFVAAASALLIVSENILREHNLTPLARIAHISVRADDPIWMLTAPMPATEYAVKKSGIKLNDIELVEINEAFASVAMAWQKEMEYPMNQINVNGGAIALGHPLGATGARLMTTMVHNMKRDNIKYGLQTMCEGGGQANVTILENCS